MIRFECDYAEGAHPRILERLVQTNDLQTAGYGCDEICETAQKMIRLACGNEQLDVHFLVGGTQSNATVVASALRAHQAVVSPETGHIAGHESGAIEATGHKVLTLPTQDGKITAKQVRAMLGDHYRDPDHEHTPQPAMVYISQPTETGMIYTKRELQELQRACWERDVFLFVDGARLGYALAADKNDVYLADLAKLCDVFYIGGTKVGAMFGEAVCIVNDKLKPDFRYHIKQHGGLLAKGRLLGIQFETLFRDGLYLEISRRAVAQAMRIKTAFYHGGCSFLYDSPTNQQFPIVNSMVMAELRKNYSFKVWKPLEDDYFALRFVTSWATEETAVDSLVSDIERVCRLYGKRPTPIAQEPLQ